MTVTYCTAAQVASLIQFNQTDGFTTTTKPTTSQVEEIINRMEDEIDHKTQMSFGRATTVTDEYYDIDYSNYEIGTGVPVYLTARNIRTLTTASGDKLEVWDGSSWIDWLTTKTEGRDEDYWIDGEMGILYLKTAVSLTKSSTLRLTYRYGLTSVPKDIENCCAMMVARELLMSDDRSMLLPEGTSNISLSQKMEYWTKRIEEIMSNRAEISIGLIP